ncbi:hypothetical protein ACFFGF_01985 [Asaia lannensis]|uniref:Uncharacterized protein n=1 Tax=Asaia lannensis NBRC 102526 TaxID=1307926 RepID=A0ABT1CD58_9PROT|nr:hypothetical protein [Asaia lannensis]MCO6158790.1 hypothetical protein [Asaia lannensis NBRC 102526]
MRRSDTVSGPEVASQSGEIMVLQDDMGQQSLQSLSRHPQYQGLSICADGVGMAVVPVYVRAPIGWSNRRMT